MKCLIVLLSVTVGCVLGQGGLEDGQYHPEIINTKYDDGQYHSGTYRSGQSTGGAQTISVQSSSSSSGSGGAAQFNSASQFSSAGQSGAGAQFDSASQSGSAFQSSSGSLSGSGSQGGSVFQSSSAIKSSSGSQSGSASQSSSSSQGGSASRSGSGSQSDAQAVVKEDIRTINENGYSYKLSIDNGIELSESGQIDHSAANAPLRAKGYYQFLAPDGVLYRVDYVADENGFQPTGDHLPTPPPIPEEIQKALSGLLKPGRK
ncbi:pupal cuticle protein 20-like [Malaya genurostris]|uniref:pupal cuticle protein 20-like n=1 Tax=Malaya genurostris TaxID=325434 RepID=UPI0026F380B6|nr:pupal cuticle protein 20-like [Malaya genurostris]